MPLLSIFPLYILAASTTLGKHSEARTSCHSPVVGSCKDIQPGCLLHWITSPRLLASSSSCCCLKYLSKAALFLDNVYRSASSSTLAGASTCSRSSTARRCTSLQRKYATNPAAFKCRTP